MSQDQDELGHCKTWTLDWTEHAHCERRQTKWRSFIISSESEDSDHNGAVPGANR